MCFYSMSIARSSALNAVDGVLPAVVVDVMINAAALCTMGLAKLTLKEEFSSHKMIGAGLIILALEINLLR